MLPTLITCIFTSFTLAENVIEDKLIQRPLLEIMERLEDLKSKYEEDFEVIFSDLDNFAARLDKLEQKVSKRLDSVPSLLEDIEAFYSISSCHILSMFGINESGLYSISDSKGTKMAAKCNFEKQFTEISGEGFDSPFYLDLTQEALNSSIQVKFSYLAKMDQIQSLIDSSENCHQTFRFDCKSAPILSSNVSYAKWLDKYGNPQYFWNGDDPNDQRCHCGYELSCLDPSLSCNCNQKQPDWLMDIGIISAKNLLPITAFHYGPMTSEMKKARIHFGSLKCSGSQNFTCDLQGICLAPSIITLETSTQQKCHEICTLMDNCKWISYNGSNHLCNLYEKCLKIEPTLNGTTRHVKCNNE